MLGYAVSAYHTRGVLVDTGCPGVEPELARWLETTRPRGAMVTHYHEDHAGNLALLAERGVPVAAGPATLQAARQPAPIRLYRRATWGAARPVTAPVTPFADDVLQLVPSPGHSPDHHLVWDPERRQLFAGDLFLGVRVRVAHSEEDPEALVRSLRAAADLAPVVLFDAHRGAVAEPVPLLRAKADWLEETMTEIRGLLRDGVPETEVRDRVLGPEGWEGLASRGEYSRLSLVRAVGRAGTG